MLVALQTEEEQKRGFWSRGWRRGRAPVTSQFVRAGEGRFLLITARKDRTGGLNWKAIRQIACGESGRMLLPKGLVPPRESGVLPFQGELFRQELMRRTAIFLLHTFREGRRRLQVGVYDPTGRASRLTSTLLPYGADIKVVTGRPDGYAHIEKLAMDSYGLSLPVSGEVRGLDGMDLVVAPNGLKGIYPRTRGLILSGVPETQPGVVGGYIPKVPPGCLESLPEGCDAWEFLAGLFERSGMKELAAQPPLLLRIGEKNISLREAAWRLAGLDIGISV